MELILLCNSSSDSIFLKNILY